MTWIFSGSEKMWIPPGETNQLRVSSFIDVQSARLNLLVQGGQKLLETSGKKTEEKDPKKEKEEENWLWRTLEKYWKGIPEFKIPLPVTEGTAIFKVKGEKKPVPLPFNAVYPKEKKGLYSGFPTSKQPLKSSKYCH